MSSPNPASSEAHPQLQAYIHRLLTTLQSVQQQIDRLDAEMQHSSAQIEALTQHLTDTSAVKAFAATAADLQIQQEAQQEQLAALEQSLTKLTRTQFKANALAESEQKQLAEAMAALQAIVTRRETAQTELTWRDQRYVAQLRQRARVELVVTLLPVLDGLEAALSHGRRLLQGRRDRVARQKQTPPPPPALPTLRQRLQLALGDKPLPAPQPAIVQDGAEVDEALSAWLEGVGIVHERFLALLRGEGIQSMAAAEESFDPHRHVAVAVVTRDDLPEGAIVEVLRPGYLHGNRVLRFAEVVVAKPTHSPTPMTSE